MNYRIGQGMDVHPLSDGCRLMIGGIHIPYHLGSKGHSDGDPLLHALVDAILGAGSRGDIGSHFPSTDPRWENAGSDIFLKHSLSLLLKHGYIIENIDSTIILQKPVLRQYIPKIQQNISRICKIPPDQVSVKATTTDNLGFIGRCEGVAAMANVLCKMI